MAALAANTVASLLRDGATRAATLDALEQVEAGTINREVSLAAAPALFEALAADAMEVGRDVFERTGLLLGRLVAEVANDPSAVYGAALREGRYATFLRSKDSVLAQTVRKPPSELRRADARTFACSKSFRAPSLVKGFTQPYAAAGFAKTAEFYALHMAEDWFCK